MNRFEKTIKPLLTYVGSIGAGLMVVAYVITVFVLIEGFKVEDTLNMSIFAIVNALVGFCIMQFLKIQGESFAKNLPENQETLKEFSNTKVKKVKFHSMAYYWVTSVLKDLLVKCLTLAATSVGVIYIVVEGSKDYNLLLLAIVNLIMFVCFGLLSLVNAYDFYNEKHIPYLKNKLGKIKQVTEKVEGENKNA